MSYYGNLLEKVKELHTEMERVFNTETDEDIVEAHAMFDWFKTDGKRIDKFVLPRCKRIF